MKYALISEEQISQAEGYLASACADPSVSVGLLKVLHIIQSLKPSEPVFFVSRDATKFDTRLYTRLSGKQIVAERFATKMYDTPVYALEQSK